MHARLVDVEHIAINGLDTFEGRDAFVARGMEDGVREGYERLDGVLAG